MRGWLLFLLPLWLYAKSIDIATTPMPLKTFELLYASEPVGEVWSLKEAMDTTYRAASNSFAKGYIDHGLWLKLPVYNHSKHPISRIVRFDEPFMDRADLYLVQDGRVLYQEANGLQQPFDQRTLKSSSPAYRVIFPNGFSTLYIRYQSYFSSFARVELYDEAGFYKVDSTYQRFYGVYFGAVFAILLYNLVLLFILRDRSYLYYLLYGFFFSFWMLKFSGVSLPFLQSAQWHYFLHISTPICFIFLILFTRSLLQTKEHLPTFDRILKRSLYLFSIPIVIIPFNIADGYHVLNLLVSLSVGPLLYVGYRSHRMGNPVARLYLAALGLFLLGTALLSIMALGYLPNNAFTRDTIIYGSFGEIILFALALAYRVRSLEKERYTLQSKLLAQETTQKQSLEQEVRLRTEQLEKLNRDLEVRVAYEVEENRAKEKLLELQSRHAQMGEMIDMILHQWKQPLTVIPLLVADLHLRFQDGVLTDAHLKQVLGRVESQIQFMNQTSLRFRNFFRQHDKKQIFSIYEVIMEVEALLAKPLELDGVALHLNGDRSIVLLGYENEFMQVFLNLISNSRNAFKERSIHEGMISIDLFEEPDGVRIEMCDNAGGIQPTLLPHIFKAHITERKAQGGTGMGLYMSQLIIKKMGGLIKAHNRNGHACFTIIFPKALALKE